MNRTLALVLGAVVLAGGAFLGVRFGCQPPPPPSGPPTTTFEIERIEVEEKSGKKITGLYTSNRYRALGMRAENAKHPFTLSGRFSPATATIDGEIVVRQARSESGPALEKRYAPVIDPKKPGTWQIVVPPESPWPLPLNQNYTVTTAHGKKLGVILVGGIETTVAEATIQLAMN